MVLKGTSGNSLGGLWPWDEKESNSLMCLETEHCDFGILGNTVE